MSVSIEVMHKLTFDEPTQSFWVENASEQRLTFSSPVLSKEELEKRVNIIWGYTKQHPVAMALLQKSLHNGSISVSFRNLAANVETGACWINYLRRMEILSTETNAYELLAAFIFELNNSINENLSKIISQDADDFAIKIETEEYKTHQNTVQIMSDGVELYGWPKSKFPRVSVTLEQFICCAKFTRSNSGISHFDSYKVYFYELIIEGLDSDIAKEMHSRACCEKRLRLDSVNNHLEKNEDIQTLRIRWQRTNAAIEQYQMARAVSVCKKEKIENEASNWLKQQQGKSQTFLPGFLNCTKTAWAMAAITTIGILVSCGKLSKN